MLVSPITAFFLGGAVVPTLFILAVVLMYLVSDLRKVNFTGTLFPIFFIIVVSTITALYWQDYRIVGVPLFLCAAIVTAAISTNSDVYGFVDIASIFMLILCFGAIVSLIYVFLGGPPLASFPNPDGRLNYIFLGTISNSYWGPLIRPAGIFDEPGAFSFFICATVTMRRILEKDSRLSWALLILGMVTMSLAHIVFIFFYFLSDRLSVRSMACLFILSFIGYLFIKQSFAYELFQQVFLSRFEIADNGLLKGDNRTGAFFAAADLLTNIKVFLWGISPESYFNPEDYFSSSGLPPIGSNPLSKLVRMGFVMSSIYYMVVFIFLGSFIRGKKYFAVVGFGLLLLQRDFVFVISYSLFVMLILRYTVFPIKTTLNKRENLG